MLKKSEETGRVTFNSGVQHKGRYGGCADEPEKKDHWFMPAKMATSQEAQRQRAHRENFINQWTMLLEDLEYKNQQTVGWLMTQFNRALLKHNTDNPYAQLRFKFGRNQKLVFTEVNS